MSHKLKGNNLAYVAQHLVSCSKHSSKRWAKVVTDSADAGSKVYNILKAAYKPSDYSKGLDWEDFSMKFDTVTGRDEAVQDINEAVAEYMEAHPDQLDTPLDDPIGSGKDDKEGYRPGQTTGGGANATPDSPEETKTDWTTYIILGAAAAIIIALVVWKRK